MNNAEKLGHRLGGVIAAFPWQSKVVAWTFIGLILAGGLFALWHTITEGGLVKLITLLTVVTIVSWRSYRQVTPKKR